MGAEIKHIGGLYPSILYLTLILLAVFALYTLFYVYVLSGYSIVSSTKDKYEIIEVDRIFVSTPKQYICLKNEDGVIKIFKIYFISTNLNNFKIIADVPSSKKKYIKHNITRMNSDEMYVDALEIHIHDINDISPGSYDLGKFGTGINSELP